MAKKKFKYVDITGFSEVVNQLAKITGKEFDQVLKAEVGHVLKGAMSRTKISSVNGRLKKGKRSGGIVPRHIPQGLKHQRGQGDKMITKQEGRTFHVGEPILLRQNPDERLLQKPKGFKKKTGVGRGKGVHPKRGGKVWLKPYGPWMGKAKFTRYVDQQRNRVDRKIDRIGMGRGQWYWHAMRFGLMLPGSVPHEAKLLKPKIRALVNPYIKPKTKIVKRVCQYTIETSGAKVTGHSDGAMAINIATKARMNLFRTAVKKEFVKDIKHYMPKKYPLLFR